VDVTLRVRNDVAEHGIDFGGPVEFTVTFPAGTPGVETYRPIFTVPLLLDSELEDIEVYYIEIVSVQGGGYVPDGYEDSTLYIADGSIKAYDDAKLVDTDNPVLIDVLSNDHSGLRPLHIAAFTQP
jgi:hypothetical protein